MPIERADTHDFRIFLARRVREFSKKQPELRELRRILLKIGGQELVPPDANDPMTSFLIDFGIVFSGPVLLKVCGHRRPAPTLGHVWSRRLYGIVGVGVGYAMSDDGLWREHTFGILREGVLEIVSPRQKYFGLLLIGEAADGFAEAASR